MKFNKIFRRALLLGGGIASIMTVLSASAAVMQTFTALPTANCGTTSSFTATNNCIQFGDFSVYSLALLSAQAKFASTGIIPTTNPNPGDPFYVASNVGELGNNGYIVYGTGTNNSGVVTNGAGTLIDNAQQQATGSVSTYVVSPTTETTPTFTGDLTTSWDGTLSAIRTELAAGSTPNGQFVVYFNLNETGGNGLDGIDLLTWFHITLKDLDGGLADKNYYLTGNTGSTTAPTLSNLSDPNWVYVHGTICISATAGFLGFGPCTAAQTTAGGKNIDQNLGANVAAFAIFNADLSANVLNSGYDIIRGEWEFAALNNGFEQFFSGLTPVGRQKVPEPASIALLGLGLLGVAFSRRRRQS